MGVVKVFGGASGGGGAGYDYNVLSITAAAGNASVTIRWTDPEDGDWEGTKIIRKTGGYPKSTADGVLVVDSKTRNQYRDSGLEDGGLVNEITYYYKAFPYSRKGYNVSYLNRAAPVTPMGLVPVTYTGAHTVREVVHGGFKYQEWALTGSGIFTSAYPASVHVWLCAGGSTGTPSSSSSGVASRGGLGAFAASAEDMAISGDIPVVIGAGGAVPGGMSGSTSFGALTAAGVARGTGATTVYYGGTGGGRSRYGNNSATAADRGDGISKIPFGDTANFSGQPHCAGGGSGGIRDTPVGSTYALRTEGGAGGSDGSDGELGATTSATDATPKPGGPGGVLGGGQGGQSQTTSGTAADTSTDATFYGGGGGAKGYYRSLSTSHTYAGVRAGYQGIVYVRVPMGAA